MKKTKWLRLTTAGPVIVVLVLLIAFGIFGAVNTRLAEENTQQAIRAISSPITTTSAKLLFNPLYILDVAETNRILAGYVDGKAIVFAAVYNSAGRRITTVSSTYIPDETTSSTLALRSISQRAQAEQLIDQYLILTTPIQAGNETIGAVEFVFDQDAVRTTLGSSQLQILLTIATILIGAATLFFYLIRSAVAPLVRLSGVAQKIGEGDLHVTVPLNGAQEITLLAQSLESMRVQLQATHSQLEQRTKDLEIVAEVGTAIATILEADKLLQEVVNLTKERFNLYHSHIYLLDENGENLVLASGAGEAGIQMKAQGLSIPLNREKSLVARAARDRKGVTVNDVTLAPDFLPNPLLPDTRSELAVPMIVGGKVIGVFDIQSDAVGRFTDSDVHIQTTLAAQVAASIQNVRSFEQFKAQADLESLANAIGQKIQRTTTVEDTLQTAIREIGTALGATRVRANIYASHHDGDNRGN